MGGVRRESALTYGRTVFDDAEKQYFLGNPDAAYYKLGRALHILQDMSSPAHVFLASHGLEGVTYDWTTAVTGYETWVLDNKNKLSQGAGLSPVSLSSWDEYARNLAQATYNATAISGSVAESEAMPATGELSAMFPTEATAEQGVSYLEYVSQLGLIKYWTIAGVGMYDPYKWFPFVDNAWFAVDNGQFYIASPQSAFPANYKGTPNTAKKSLAEVWVTAGGLIDLPIAYSAGLMKYFYDQVSTPPYLKKVTLTQGDKVVYSGEWADGPGSRTLALGVNEPITAATQLNMELEFSKPIQSASA